MGRNLSFPSSEEIDKLLEAGKFLCKLFKDAEEMIRAGTTYIELCETLERKIIEKGYLPAFPVNVSVDAVAAHDTARVDDKREVKGRFVKVDIGVCVDGWTADAAVTINLGGDKELIKCCKEALKAAIEVVRPGVRLWEIGKAVEQVVEEFGFSPIYNLYGHSIGRWILHSGKSIPNYNNNDKTVLEEGELIAIEPFITDGAGYVREKGDPLIFSIKDIGRIRDYRIRRELEKIYSIRKSLPFSVRWIKDPVVKKILSSKIGLRMVGRYLESYPPLVNVSGNDVVQFERTLVVYDPPVVITPW